MANILCNSRLTCGVNKAFLNITNNQPFPVTLLTKASECHGCPMTVCTDIAFYSSKSFIVSTLHPMILAYSPLGETDVLCNTSFQFTDASSYNWDLNPSRLAQQCEGPYLVEQGRSIYTRNAEMSKLQFDDYAMFLALISLLGIVLTAAVLYFLLSLFIKKVKNPEPGVPEVPRKRNSNVPKRSTDTFLGLCLLLHMFFNYNRIHYAFARNSIWDGLELPDLIYPWILWTTGFGITSKMSKMFAISGNRCSIIIRTTATCGKLILVGLMMTSLRHYCTFDKMPFTGPLQQLAVIYFIIASMEILFVNDNQRDYHECMMAELVTCPFQWISYTTLIVVFASIYFTASAPGCPVMYSGPGGSGADEKYYNCTGGIAGYLDRMIFGEHISLNYEFAEVYAARPVGLYGFLSTFSGSAAMFGGYMAGKTYTLTRYRAAISVKMILGSMLAFFVGSVLFNGCMPLNYNLLSLPLMLLAICTANMLHLILTWLIDWLQLWDGKPLSSLGRNALLIYILHSILNPCFPIFWFTCQNEVSHWANVILSGWAILLFTAFSMFLHEQRIYLTF